MADRPLWDPTQVRKAVLKETIQHPVTLLFGASSMMTALYLALIQGSRTGLMIALASLGLSMGSWIFNYFIRSDHFVQKYFERWQRDRERERKRMLEEIRNQFVELAYEPGVREYDDLVSAFSKYKKLLLGSSENSLTSLQKVQLEGTAEETFDLGIRMLTKLASLVTIVRSVDIERFNEEIKQLNSDIGKLEKKAKSSQNDSLKQASMIKRRDAIQARVDSYQQASVEIEGLLTRAEECENAIENSILQMPVLSGTIDDQQLRKAISGMEMTVEAAKRVSERLAEFERSDQQTDVPEDDIYLNAGRTS